MRLFVFAFLFASPLSFALDAGSNKAWETWVTQIRAHKAGETLPGRPDKKKIGDPLPEWVDCQLSWEFDRGRLKLPGQIVLRTQASSCKGHPIEWAK